VGSDRWEVIGGKRAEQPLREKIDLFVLFDLFDLYDLFLLFDLFLLPDLSRSDFLHDKKGLFQ